MSPGQNEPETRLWLRTVVKRASRLLPRLPLFTVACYNSVFWPVQFKQASFHTRFCLGRPSSFNFLHTGHPGGQNVENHWYHYTLLTQVPKSIIDNRLDITSYKYNRITCQTTKKMRIQQARRPKKDGLLSVTYTPWPVNVTPLTSSMDLYLYPFRDRASQPLHHALGHSS